jgi:hypothetical protein
MTTIADRRTELAAALVAGGVSVTNAPGRVSPPVAVLIAAGSDLEGVGRGQVAYGFRVVLVAGAADADASALRLDELVGDAIAVLRNLDGWRLTTVGATSTRDIAGALYLTADVTASAMIDL